MHFGETAAQVDACGAGGEGTVGERVEFDDLASGRPQQFFGFGVPERERATTRDRDDRPGPRRGLDVLRCIPRLFRAATGQHRRAVARRRCRRARRRTPPSAPTWRPTRGVRRPAPDPDDVTESPRHRREAERRAPECRSGQAHRGPRRRAASVRALLRITPAMRTDGSNAASPAMTAACVRDACEMSTTSSTGDAVRAAT